MVVRGSGAIGRRTHGQGSVGSNPTSPSIRNVYELHNTKKGETVYILGPGPSSEDFPVQALDGRNVISLNAALDLLYRPAWWLGSDRRFIKNYAGIFEKGTRAPNVVVPAHHARGVARRFGGENVWSFTYRTRFEIERHSAGQLFWFNSDSAYLPGRMSVASNGISLACLLGAERTVLVGVDMSHRREVPFDRRYNRFVTGHFRRKIEWLTEKRDLPLERMARWMRKAINQGAWPTKLQTTSPYLPKRIPIEWITVEDALNA